MFKVVCSHWKKRWFLLILPLILLCGCSSLGTSQAAPAATAIANQASLAATAAAKQASLAATATANQAASLAATAAANQVSLAATAAAQTAFNTYVGKWEVHDSVLTINANGTGLEQWNAGPCGNTLCGGNAQITFTVNTDGSIKGVIQSVSYSQGNGNPTPAGFQPDPSDQKAGDTFQLQHSGAHLLYATWFGQASSHNTFNRYWCGSGASQAEQQKCGA